MISSHTNDAWVSVSGWASVPRHTSWANVPAGQPWFGYGQELIGLGVKSGSITLDETWVPYCQATLTCSAPDPAVAAQIDPRYDARVRITLAQQFAPWEPNVPAVARTFDLLLRTRVLDHSTGELILTAASDEAMLQDYSLLTKTPYEPGSTTARAITTYVLSLIGATLVHGDEDAPVSAEAAEWLPGVTADSYLDPILQASGLRLWCDEQRAWHLDPTGLIGNGNVDLDYDTTLTQAQDTVDLDDTGSQAYYDAVIIDYRWTDGNGAEHHTYDVAGISGPKRVLTLEYDTKPQAPGAAARVRERAMARGRSLNLATVSQFDAAPLTPATIALPDLPLQAAVVSAVTWKFPADEMDVVTRDILDIPDGSWLAVEPRTAWRDLPTGISWQAFDASRDYSDPNAWKTALYGTTWADLDVGTPWTLYTTGA